MKIPRVHIPEPLIEGQSGSLPESAHAHAVRVLRLEPGAELLLFDGRGGEYRAVLTEVGRRQSAFRVTAHLRRERESPLRVTLLQGVSRGDRMDYALQKATELGVASVVCVFCTRSVVRLSGERLARKLAHWQGVIVSACEQSGRNRLPDLQACSDFDHALQLDTLPTPRIVMDSAAASGLIGIAPPVSSATLLVGPEGGLTNAELTAAKAKGFQPVRFGPRTMRTETAGVASLAALQVLWGDLG